MKNFNAFTIRLTDYIIHNHPDRITDTEFIDRRGQEAVAAFAEYSRQGYPLEVCNDEAGKVLYYGLHFSPVKMIGEILDREFSEIKLLSIHRGSIIMQLLAYVKPTLDRYHNEENDAVFEGSTQYPTAYAHVTRMINQYIHDNGLQ